VSEAGGRQGALSLRVKELALSLGFDLAGVAGPEPSEETEFFRGWVEAGYAGDMHYLGRRTEERVDPRRVMDGVRSVICVGLVYDPGVRPTPLPGAGRVSRYAGGEDYHEVLKDRLEALAAGLEALAQQPVRTRAYVDTGPVLERVLAARAGLGWIGKNCCLIHPRLGSYVFLGVLLTDLPLGRDVPEPDHCGSCRACLDACPTQAFVAPHVLDARRCIAYTTIELRDAIPQPLRAAHGAHVFGCDICQEVCPWNQRERRRIPPDPHALRARLAPRPEWVAPDLAWLLSLPEESWRAATRHTALRRAKRRALLRNALVAAGNSGEARLLPLVREHAASDDALLAEHARWALERLGGGR
jgi:epoxyqueuosine reductase